MTSTVLFKVIPKYGHFFKKEAYFHPRNKNLQNDLNGGIPLIIKKMLPSKVMIEDIYKISIDIHKEQ